MKAGKCGLWNQRQPALFFAGIILGIVLWGGLQLLSGVSLVRAQVPSPNSSDLSRFDLSQFALPQPQVHPLPDQLAEWQDPDNQGDYFSEIKTTPVGYLLWSTFPVKVYLDLVEPAASPPVPAPLSPDPLTPNRSQQWVTAVTQAVQDWRMYFPLELVDSADQADITIVRSAPPLQGFNANAENASPNNPSPEASGNNPSTSAVNRLPRVRSAETRYQIFVDRPSQASPMLAHRFTIHLTPNQTPAYTLATARHELGHALGIWGHSPLETDALYFSQVRNSPPISHRDINTLKRIYQQPTLLGWALEIKSNP